MKMMYNGTQIKSLNVNHYELSSNDCDMIASDLQAGKTAVARGKKITGTGKCFEFANYGLMRTNTPDYIPAQINVIEIASLNYPVKSLIALTELPKMDFSTEQVVCIIVIDGVEYPISVKIDGVLLTLKCDKTIALEVFLGKDNYYD